MPYRQEHFDCFLSDLHVVCGLLFAYFHFHWAQTQIKDWKRHKIQRYERDCSILCLKNASVHKKKKKQQKKTRKIKVIYEKLPGWTVGVAGRLRSGKQHKTERALSWMCRRPAI